MTNGTLPTFKIIIIGESGVGKTKLLKRFLDEHDNSPPRETVGLEGHIKQISVDGRVVKLALWDTAGQERFRAVTPKLYRDTQGVLLVYDVNSYTSFLKLQNWLDELEVYGIDSDVVKMIAGNKIDLVDMHQVKRREGLRFATRHDCLFAETSAELCQGVCEAFEDLVDKILLKTSYWKKNGSPQPQDVVVLGAPPENNSNSCKCN